MLQDDEARERFYTLWAVCGPSRQTENGQFLPVATVSYGAAQVMGRKRA